MQQKINKSEFLVLQTGTQIFSYFRAYDEARNLECSRNIFVIA